MKQTVKCAVIGTGMMGKEFASAAMRWSHLSGTALRPEIISICGGSLPESDRIWYREGLGTVTQETTDYREVLKNPEVEAVYCAVPHHLHEEIYTACIQAGKHLMGEKPFGIDKGANERILEAAERRPEVFVRCSSQFPFVPAVQKLCSMLAAGQFGTIIEAEAGFMHSSDLNPDKPINWKRRIETNGAYGCMGDLGMHILHVPLRAKWRPLNVRAILSNIIPRRRDEQGNLVPCDTWDNATLFCETEAPGGERFPLTLKTQRIAPGEKNSWYLTVKGTKGAASFSTKQINTLSYLLYDGKAQEWRTVDMGHETAFPSITGDIFEFGMSDALMQMWAAFFHELEHRAPLSRFAGCVTPEETRQSHLLFTAALNSHRTGNTIVLSGS